MAPVTVSLECGSLQGSGACMAVLEEGAAFPAAVLCAEAEPRSSPGCAAEGTHTLWNSPSTHSSASAAPQSHTYSIPMPSELLEES